ncbi:hypothetical protein QYE76_040631 [Lolium multiflorum]|uniref:Uncharacterized protein n=1 Tax=Lolium multiflorum TaxID=4521 RepID=A0AAD8TD49_LOLMU|nr:hypothetical protein QYE76_040631 [Lolium multiflorum]
MTGTSINPLFHAAYLAKDGSRDVTLVIPWLSIKDQELVYPNKIVFDSPLEQEGYVRCWIEGRVDFRPSFSIKFYPAKDFTLAPKRPTAAERKMAEGVMAATEATNAKLDALTEQLAGLASWTKNMDAAVADLASATTTLKMDNQPWPSFIPPRWITMQLETHVFRVAILPTMVTKQFALLCLIERLWTMP